MNFPPGRPWPADSRRETSEPFLTLEDDSHGYPKNQECALAGGGEWVQYTHVGIHLGMRVTAVVLRTGQEMAAVITAGLN